MKRSILLLGSLAPITLGACYGQPVASEVTTTTVAESPSTTRSTMTLPPPPPSLQRPALPRALCQPILVPDTTFASGSPSLVGAAPQLEQVVANLSEARRYGVELTANVIGHTDDVPSRYPGGNWGLSRDRARHVADRLAALGADPSWLAVIDGRADTEPAVPGTDPAARAANRRVEITFNCPPP